MKKVLYKCTTLVYFYLIHSCPVPFCTDVFSCTVLSCPIYITPSRPVPFCTDVISCTELSCPRVGLKTIPEYIVLQPYYYCQIPDFDNGGRPDFRALFEFVAAARSRLVPFHSVVTSFPVLHCPALSYPVPACSVLY